MEHKQTRDETCRIQFHLQHRYLRFRARDNHFHRQHFWNFPNAVVVFVFGWVNRFQMLFHVVFHFKLQIVWPFLLFFYLWKWIRFHGSSWCGKIYHSGPFSFVEFQSRQFCDWMKKNVVRLTVQRFQDRSWKIFLFLMMNKQEHSSFSFFIDRIPFVSHIGPRKNYFVIFREFLQCSIVLTMWSKTHFLVQLLVPESYCGVVSVCLAFGICNSFQSISQVMTIFVQDSNLCFFSSVVCVGKEWSEGSPFGQSWCRSWFFPVMGTFFGRHTSCGRWGDPCEHDVDARRLGRSQTAIRQGESVHRRFMHIVVRPDRFTIYNIDPADAVLRACVLMQGQDGWPDPETRATKPVLWVPANGSWPMTNVSLNPEP